MFHILLHRLPITRIKIKIANILYLFITLFIGKGERIIVRNGIQYEVDLAEGIDLSIFLFGNFQRHITENRLVPITPKAVIFDIGANFGVMSLQFAKTAYNGKVYSFEPTHYAFKRFKKNLQLNPLLSKRIVPINLFVSSHTKSNPRMRAFSSWKISGKTNGKLHPIHLGTAKSTQGVGSVSLDNYCKKNKINRIDFIKIDTDGWEHEVLKGARKVISKYCPTVIFEVGKYAMEEKQIDFNFFLNYFTKINYRLIDAQSKKEINAQNHLSIIPLYSTIDIIAIHNK